MATPAAAPRPSAPDPRPSRLALAKARHRSPLRRRSDRQRLLVTELQTLALVLAAGLCVLLGTTVYQQSRVHAVQEAQALHPVSARLVSDPQPNGVAGETAQVSWTGPNGKPEQGAAQVSAHDAAGDRVQIWLDASGSPTTAPESVQDSVGNGVLTALLSMIGVSTVITAAGAFGRARLARADAKAWDAEWEVFEPVWSRRR